MHKTMLAKINFSLQIILLLVIKLYQLFLSPFLGGHCRYYPTCSCYAEQAINHYGCWRGGWLSVKRLLRCHPFHAGGFDPVPNAENLH